MLPNSPLEWTDHHRYSAGAALWSLSATQGRRYVPGRAMKKYAIVIDTSPTEQIIDNDDQIFCLGILFGLRSPESFDLVGSQFPDEGKRLNLRKYAGSSLQYKANLKEHLANIRAASRGVV